MVTSTWLRMLNTHAMVLKKRGVTLSIPIPKCMFLNEDVGVTLDYEDLLDWCFKREVGESQMNIFIKYLKGHCQNEGVSGMYGFCDTNVLSPMTPTIDEEVRSDYLARVFGCNEGKNVNQLFFAPYNDNMHWRLAVISPWNGLVCWLNPTGEENEINEFSKKIINKGLKKFSMVHRKDIKKIKKDPYIEWKQPKCPRQPQYSKVCGYYVCRYMLEIIQKRVLWVSDKFFKTDPCTYSTENIDEIRDLWLSMF
ncbi:uncharacterized protein LOC110734490 [Chenopodium quinoa]|uniref:uncharacterized protein LOC110734490 n=1 Tax=Chenopodium quinoa TaxID=63459 RepID=UPI000B771312|nr:uncharacterized protein LOC110734490 [Chenopodium quinoa]